MGHDEEGGQIVSIASEETAWVLETIAQDTTDLTDRIASQAVPQDRA